MRPALALALLWVLGGAGCSALKPDFGLLFEGERRARIETAAEAYGNSLRWGLMEQAASWVHPSRRRDFLAQMGASAGQLRFTLFELESIELGPERPQAQVVARFSLYRPPALQEQSILEYQHWTYEPHDRRWYLKPDLALYRGDVAGGGTP